jgi:membrane-associated phospholipid phosphatase
MDQPHNLSRRQRLFLFGYLVVAALLFVALAVLARSAPYLSIDLAITRFIQSFRNPTLDLFMQLVGAPGYFPQTLVLNALFVLILALCRIKWATLTLVVVGSMAGLTSTWLRYTIDRPRPSADLVWVAQRIEEGHFSFPSGHVLGFTAVLGFILYLGLTELAPSWHRNLLVLVYALFLALEGISRIYVGEHWPTDVLAGYVYGSIWMVLMILFYRWLRSR